MFETTNQYVMLIYVHEEKTTFNLKPSNSDRGCIPKLTQLYSETYVRERNLENVYSETNETI